LRFGVSSRWRQTRYIGDWSSDVCSSDLIAQCSPFTHVVELIRFALYGQFNVLSFAVVSACMMVFFVLAVMGYDPQRGLVKKVKRG